MKNSQPRRFSRRQFLGEASCATVGTISVLSTLLNLKMANQLAASDLVPTGSGATDYKSLVCIFQAGGNDSFNMLVPRGNTEYGEYAATRSNLALPQGSLLNLNLDAAQAGSGLEDRSDFGLHPGMSEIADMFNGTGAFAGNRRLSLVSNVGTLIEPTTKTEYVNGSVEVPKALFSHVDQIEQWQTAVPQGLDELSGWAGRAADVMHSIHNINQTSMNVATVPMNISVSGRSALQTGQCTEQFVITPSGGLLFSQRLPGLFPNFGLMAKKNEGLDSMIGRQYTNLLEQTFADLTADSIEKQNEFQATFENPGAGIEAALASVSWPASGFSSTLQAAARTIAIRDQLDLRRQTLFVQYGGWDHHGELLDTQDGMLQILSQGVSAFQEALEALGIQDDVVTFSASDFGRTLRSNGRGTDHAWGGNQFVFGGPVDAGHVFGTYPSLVLDSNDDVGRGGRILPSSPVDGFVGELLKWFGVSKQNLPYVLPNFENFYDLNSFYDEISPTLPLGIIT